MATATTDETPPSSPHQRSVVSSFLCTGHPHTPSFRVSIFKRSSHVRVYKNLWAACSGSIEPTDPTPLSAALREIAEETSLAATSLTLLRAGEAYDRFDADINTNWTIYPFLFQLKVPDRPIADETMGAGDGKGGEEEGAGDVKPQRQIMLDWEHTEFRFVRVEEVEAFETVAHLGRSLRQVLEGAGTEQAQEKERVGE